MTENQVFEVEQYLGDGEYFVALMDAATGTVVVRGWTTQPVNWLEWAAKIGSQYNRFRRRGASPHLAAKAARLAVMASGPSNMRFVDRMAEVAFPPLP